MPATLSLGFFVFGAVLVLIALVGGTFKIFSVMVSSPHTSLFVRVISFFLGGVFLMLAVYIGLSDALAKPEDTHTTVEPSVPPTIQQATLPVAQPLPTNPPPALTDTPEPPAVPNPVEFVTSYWENVSNGDFMSAWNQLSPRFRQAIHNNNYNDYLAGYQKMQLCRIDVSGPSLVQQNAYSAVVKAHLTYYTGSQCNSSEHDFEMWLIYDNSTKSWLFDRNASVHKE